MVSENIGILGWAFNPVHNGHLAIARKAMQRFGLARVIFIPAAVSPFKEEGEHLPARHRLEMLRAALADHPGFELSEIELKRGGRSYTVDTLRELKKENPRARFFLIIGEDNLEGISRWKEIDELTAICRFIVVTRPGWDRNALEGEDKLWADRIIDEDGSNLITLKLPVSSSEIRKNLREGTIPADRLPPGVDEYLRRNNIISYE